MQQHRIENREPRVPSQTKKPLIEEIKSPIKNLSEDQNKSNQLNNVSSESVSNSTLNYVLLQQPKKGTPTHLIGLFQMPKGVR